jgi:hypothetical protein
MHRRPVQLEKAAGGIARPAVSQTQNVSVLAPSVAEQKRRHCATGIIAIGGIARPHCMHELCVYVRVCGKYVCMCVCANYVCMCHKIKIARRLDVVMRAYFVLMCKSCVCVQRQDPELNPHGESAIYACISSECAEPERECFDSSSNVVRVLAGVMSCVHILYLCTDYVQIMCVWATTGRGAGS